jgi:hypothetical protein
LSLSQVGSGESTQSKETYNEEQDDSKIDTDFGYGSSNDNELPSADLEPRQKQAQKKQRKPRSPSKLPTKIQVVTHVDDRGVSILPQKVVSGYNTTIDVLVLKGVKITCVDLRSMVNTKVWEDILD